MSKKYKYMYAQNPIAESYAESYDITDVNRVEHELKFKIYKIIFKQQIKIHKIKRYGSKSVATTRLSTCKTGQCVSM